jgi:riboflavin synthase
LFTGLVEEIGTVLDVRKQVDGIVFTIGAQGVLDGTKIGDSIAVHGACLTVTELAQKSFSVFASRVTCETTTLGSFQRNRRVHLERALRLDSRLGGHLVQGHVDGKGTASTLKKDAHGLEIEILASEEIRKFIVPRGSVAVDGVSLTVVSMTQKGFLLYLIPETLKNTTFHALSPGEDVNIETDILAKYVERMLSRQSRNDDRRLLQKMQEEGFM